MKKTVLLLAAFFAAGLIGAQAQNRGLGDPNFAYISKGQFSGGIGAAYHSYAASAGDDLTRGISLAGIINNINGSLALFDFDAEASWFFRDNMSIGAKFAYANTILDSNSLSALGLLNFSNQHVRRETYNGYLTFKRYIPMFNSKFFAAFAEGDLGGSLGYNKSYEDTDRGKEGTFTNIYSAEFKMLSGLSFFFTDFMALEVSLPVLTLAMEWNKNLEKQEYESSFTGVTLEDGLDILGTQLSMIFYF